MIGKNLILSLLTVFLVLSLVSASDLTLTQGSISPANVRSDSGSFSDTFTIVSLADQTVLLTSNLANVVFSPSATVSLVANQTRTITATVPVLSTQTGAISGIITATSQTISSLSNTLAINVPVTSPAISFNPTSVSVSPGQNATFSVSNSGVFSDLVFFSSTGDFSATLSPNTQVSIPTGSSSTLTVIPTGFDSLSFGVYTDTITATQASHNFTSTVTLTKGFCKSSTSGSNLSIESVDINSDGTDDLTWRPLDTVTVKVKVNNNGDDDISSVYAELGLFSQSGVNKVGNLDFKNADDKKIKIGTIKNGDDKTATFEFQVPADFKEDSYKLAIKTYSKSDSTGNGCQDTSSDLDQRIYQTISVEKQDENGKLIAFDNSDVSPSEATCGDQVTLSTDLVNVGSDDQDRVKIDLYNKELGILTSNELTNGLNSGDKTTTSFTFTVPNNAADKTYRLELTAEYDYSSGSDYRESSEDPTYVILKVIGCNPQSSSSGKIASISASLESGAKAGETMTVLSTITNLGNKTAAFVVSANGYASWATIGSASDSSTVTLAAGESKDVIFNFDVKKSASGDQSFVIEAQSNGNTVSKTVSVTLDKSTSTLGDFFRNNSLALIIGAVNLVLIILIIFVAIRLSRR